MGHWVTLDDDQKVYVTDSGKIAATRSAISRAGGAKERGKSLAARSKAAIGKATTKTTRAIEHAKAAGPSLREQADKARAARQYPDTAGIKHTMTPGHRAERAEYLKDLRKEAMTGIPGKERTNSGQDIKYRLGVAMADMPAKSKYGAAYGSRGNVAAGRYKRTGQADTPATARAIEHAKAAGPVKTTRESGLVPRSEQATKEERLAAIVQRSRAREGVWKSNAPFRGDKLLPSKEEVKAEVTRQNREAGAQKVNATRATKTGETKEEYARRIRKEIMRSVRGSR